MKFNNSKIPYSRKQRKVSMFFVLWATFALLAFVLLIVFSVTQRIVLRNTYEKEAIHSLDDKGKRIHRQLLDTPSNAFGGNYDGFLHYLSIRENVPIYILDQHGNVLMPLEENIDPNNPLWQESFDFTEKIVEHIRALDSVGATFQNAKTIVYATDHGFVYGAVLPPYHGGEHAFGSGSGGVDSVDGLGGGSGGVDSDDGLDGGSGGVDSVDGLDGGSGAGLGGVDSVDGSGGGVLTAGSEGVYLYVHQSLEFVEAVGRSMNARMIWIAVFVFVLTFALSSTISGVLSRPLDEIAGKAKRLAKGDFDVDFKGEDYFEEMEAVSASLNFAKDELSKADRMQKELLANVSHDFKTPLTMIKAYAEMIVEFAGENKEKRDRSANVIIEEADRLSSLVNDMLDLSKIRAGIQALQPERFDVSEYLEEILARFDYLAETQGYRFCVDIDKALYTFADRQKLGQVMYNLIGNAVNYTGDDKVVRIRLKLESDAIRFEVSDSGRGIPEEELAEIWERYYRSSETHKRPVKGTGLGLSIVKTILEKHNFRFGVNSVVGVGSSFYAFFPLCADEGAETV